MAKRSHTSFLKRQRELKKAEKAARKRAKRFGEPMDGQRERRATFVIPRPTDDAESDDREGTSSEEE